MEAARQTTHGPLFYARRKAQSATMLSQIDGGVEEAGEMLYTFY